MRKNSPHKFTATLFALVFALGGTLFLPLLATQAHAETTPQAITLTLGDYRFDPESIEVQAGQPVALTLVNSDGITPHDFILKHETAGLDIDTSVRGGATKTIEFTPVTPGSYTFYCSKKLPFMKSHRERGMEGTLIVQ